MSRSANGRRGTRNAHCGSELWSKRCPKKGISCFPRHQEGKGNDKRFAKRYTVRYERRLAKAEAMTPALMTKEQAIAAIADFVAEGLGAEAGAAWLNDRWAIEAAPR